MTKQNEIFAQMIKKATSLPVHEMKRILKEESVTPTLDNSVFEAILNALELQIGEREFIDFCDSL